MTNPIELRSDTFTLPTPAMREAMFRAEVGDDVYGEDPTVNKLEALAAEMFGKDAALFTSSGTQGNLLALLSHCQRGEEYIVGQSAHTYRYEAGGAAVLGSIQPQPLNFEADGTLDLAKVERFIKPDDYHFAKTKLLCLENTTGGKVLPLNYQAKARALAKRHGLNIHLDGARVMHAAVALGVPVSEIAQYYDSVSVCLSKGLSAPIGTVLVGDADFIARARRWRKMVGGGMRQAGIIAAAGILGLTDMVDRLAEDHANAKLLADGLTKIPGFNLLSNDTNMVFFKLEARLVGKFSSFMADRGINIGDGDAPIRAVTHYGITADDIARILSAAQIFSKEIF